MKTSTLKGLLFILLLFVLSGCATRTIENTSDYVDVPLPDQWQFAEDGEATLIDPTDWVASLGDVRLKTILEESLSEQFLLKAALARLQQADAQARITGASKYPLVNIGLDSARQENLFGDFGVVVSESNNLKLSSQWEIDLWGVLRDQHSATLAQVEAAGYQLESLTLSLSAQIAQAWFNAIEARLQYELTVKSRESFESNLKTLESRYKRGVVDAFELRLFRAQVASARASESDRYNNYQSSLLILENLLGRYPTASISISEALPENQIVAPRGVPTDLLYRRPDLKIAERQLAASLGSLSAARKNRLPNLTLSGDWGITSNEFQDLWDANNVDRTIWSIIGSLTAPVFQAGRLEAQRDLAQAQFDEQLYTYSDTVLNAVREVEQFLISQKNLTDLEQSLAEAQQQVSRAEALAWDLYNRGLQDITAYLDTQRRSIDTQSQYISVKNQMIQNQIALHVAMGGDTEEIESENL